MMAQRIVMINLNYTNHCTGCLTSNTAIRNLHVSLRNQQLSSEIFTSDGDLLKVFFHKRHVKNHSFELPYLTSTHKLDLQWNDVNDILKTFLIRSSLSVQPFDRDNCSLSIGARLSSLACFIPKLQPAGIFPRAPKSTKWLSKCVTIGYSATPSPVMMFIFSSGAIESHEVDIFWILTLHPECCVELIFRKCQLRDFRSLQNWNSISSLDSAWPITLWGHTLRVI